MLGLTTAVTPLSTTTIIESVELVLQGGSYMLVLFVLYFETGSGDLVRAQQGLKLPT